MTARARFAALVLAIVGVIVPGVASATASPRLPILLGTTGACNNGPQGGVCTQTSTLVQLDPGTGAVVRTIGPVGYTVNGLAQDRKSGRLYATTAVGDTAFHGLITIDPTTGAGRPVSASAANFGLAITPPFLGSPVHSLAIDSRGRMVAWYDEFPPPLGVTDTFVRIDPRTGLGTELPDTGIDTAQNGLAFSRRDVLWNVDTPRRHADGTVTQVAYVIDPRTGKPVTTRQLTPPTTAALGDFDPLTDRYFGLDFEPFAPHTSIVTVDMRTGIVTPLGPTLDGLHTLAFLMPHDG